MTLEDLQLKHELLVKYVTRMRAYQEKYFMYRAIQDKNNMLRYQREVDKLLKNEVKVKESKQIELL
jgi:hypothetical protein